MTCAALTWMKQPEGDDYVPCDSPEAVLCRLEGLLLSIEAPLCEVHQRYFAEKWRVNVTVIKRQSAVVEIFTAEAKL